MFYSDETTQCITYSNGKLELCCVSLQTLPKKFIKYAQKRGVLYAVKYNNGTLKYMKKLRWMRKYASKYYDGDINNFTHADFNNGQALLSACKIKMFAFMISAYILKFWKLRSVFEIDDDARRGGANCVAYVGKNVELWNVSLESLPPKIRKRLQKHGVIYAERYKNGAVKYMKKRRWMLKCASKYYDGNINNFTENSLSANEPALSAIKVKLFVLLYLRKILKCWYWLLTS